MFFFGGLGTPFGGSALVAASGVGPIQTCSAAPPLRGSGLRLDVRNVPATVAGSRNRGFGGAAPAWWR